MDIPPLARANGPQGQGSNTPSSFGPSPATTTSSHSHSHFPGHPRPSSSLAGPSRSTSLRQKHIVAAGAPPMSTAGGAVSMSDSGSIDSRPPRRPSGTSRRQSSSSHPTPAHRPRRPRDRHMLALESIRHFLRGRSSYDVLPVSFRLIVLDTKLVVGPALEVMWGAGVVSAPLWHSHPATKPPASAAEAEEQGESANPSDDVASATAEQTATPTQEASEAERSPAAPFTEPASAPASTTSALPPNPAAAVVAASDSSPLASPSISRSKPGFAGMLTVNDIIHLIQYYYHHSSYETAKQEVESFRLEGLRDIEAKLAVPPPPLLSCHPLRPLFEACQLLMKTHARRLPLLDYDEQTGIETVVSVLTQYRVLKFVAMNCRETASLYRSLRSLGVGTFVSSVRLGGGSTPGSRRGSAKADDHADTHGSHKSGSGLPTPLSTQSEEDTPREEVTEGQIAAAAAKVAEQQEQQQRQQQQQQHEAKAAAAQSQQTSGPPGQIPRTSVASSPLSNPYHPIYTATLDTTVFDVVHIFSERGISAVPVLDEEGFVVDMYESVDVITLVRSGAYQSLDLTIRQALDRRPADFPGVYSCSPDDSIANIFALLRKKRVHRLLIIEPEETPAGQESRPSDAPASSLALEEELEKSGPRLRKRGKLVGILALSDLLRHIIGLTPRKASTTPSEVGHSSHRRRTSSNETGAAVGGLSGPGSLNDSASASLHDSLVLSPIAAESESLLPAAVDQDAETLSSREQTKHPAADFTAVHGVIPEEREIGSPEVPAGGVTPTVPARPLSAGHGEEEVNSAVAGQGDDEKDAEPVAIAPGLEEADRGAESPTDPPSTEPSSLLVGEESQAAEASATVKGDAGQAATDGDAGSADQAAPNGDA
ncbi:unnamed protein product [Parajaminaea phylloscopi]